MNRIHTTCCCLIASAVVLSGLLIVQLGQRYDNRAEASLVIARDNFSLLTAQTRGNEESLFILDNTSGTLLVYHLNVARKRMELVDGLKLETLFAEAGRGGGNSDNRR